MGLKRVSWVQRYQGQCRALRSLGHQGYRLRSYKKDPPLCSGYSPPISLVGWAGICRSGVTPFSSPSGLLLPHIFYFFLALACLVVVFWPRPHGVPPWVVS